MNAITALAMLGNMSYDDLKNDIGKIIEDKLAQKQNTAHREEPRLLKLTEVERMVGLKRRAILTRVDKGLFPRPKRGGQDTTTALVCDRDEIIAYIHEDQK